MVAVKSFDKETNQHIDDVYIYIYIQAIGVRSVWCKTVRHVNTLPNYPIKYDVCDICKKILSHSLKNVLHTATINVTGVAWNTHFLKTNITLRIPLQAVCIVNLAYIE